MSSIAKKALIVVGVFAFLGVLLVIDTSIYPFRSVRPNYHDVEATFNKLQIPADWVEVSHSENSGIAGRACPIEGSGCFHKSRTYHIAVATDYELIKKTISSSGCQPVGVDRSVPVGGSPHANFGCSTNGLNVGASLHENDGTWEIDLGVST